MIGGRHDPDIRARVQRITRHEIVIEIVHQGKRGEVCQAEFSRKSSRKSGKAQARARKRSKRKTLGQEKMDTCKSRDRRNAVTNSTRHAAGNLPRWLFN